MTGKTANKYSYSNESSLMQQLEIEHIEGYATGPERQLMVAMLYDAIHMYLNSTSRSYEDAKRWIFTEAEDYVFSFQSVCSGLGLDPDYIRQGLKVMNVGRRVARRY